MHSPRCTAPQPHGTQRVLFNAPGQPACTRTGALTRVRAQTPKSDMDSTVRLTLSTVRITAVMITGTIG